MSVSVVNNTTNNTSVSASVSRGSTIQASSSLVDRVAEGILNPGLQTLPNPQLNNLQAPGGGSDPAPHLSAYGYMMLGSGVPPRGCPV